MSIRHAAKQSQSSSPSHPAVAAFAAPDEAHAGLWAFLAEVRVVAPGGHRSEIRMVRGLFCAKNHHDARARATNLAAEKARELGHVVDISLTRLW